MTLSDVLRAHGVGTAISVREAARQSGIPHHTQVVRAMQGATSELGEDALVRLAETIGADPIEVVCAAGRLPARVARYLIAHPDLVRRLDAHAEEDERASPDGAQTADTSTGVA